jgi:hypothetical protein
LTPAWHLGPQHQSISVPAGYGPDEEDALLRQADWPNNGYGLFAISCPAGANPSGMFDTPNEACFLILKRTLWAELGGMDEEFDSPGGGLVALDFFNRVLTLPEVTPVVLIGEGSFHQVHRGVTTASAETRPFSHLEEEYRRIRNIP